LKNSIFVLSDKEGPSSVWLATFLMLVSTYLQAVIKTYPKSVITSIQIT